MITKAFDGRQLSRLGLGCMRFPILPDTKTRAIDYEKAMPIVRRAYEAGINYFDTAYVYHGGDSERFLGVALQQFPRDSFVIASKYFIQGYPDHEAVFEEQLQRLQTDHIDLYLIHSIMDDTADLFLNSGCIEYFQKQKELGRIRYLGFSSHASPATLARFCDSGKWDFAQIQINYLDWYYGTAKEEYEILTARGLPVIVMEPVRGGRLQTLTPELQEKLRAMRPDWSPAEWALRWLKRLDGVQTILSGMSTVEQLEDNLSTFETMDGLTEEEEALLLKVAEEYKAHLTAPCTGCRYCTDGCPQQLDIPKLMGVYNRFAYLGELRRDAYDGIPADKQADACIGCGACATHCPQSLDIPGLLGKLAAAKK